MSDAITRHSWAVAGGYLGAAAVSTSVSILSQMTAFQRHRAIEVLPVTYAIPIFLPAPSGCFFCASTGARPRLAALVLALSFALLAIVPLRAFFEIAFAMGAGLLIDAFVIRAMLVPALIVLVGPRSAWPGNALRRVPAIHPADMEPRPTKTVAARPEGARSAKAPQGQRPVRSREPWSVTTLRT